MREEGMPRKPLFRDTVCGKAVRFLWPLLLVPLPLLFPSACNYDERKPPTASTGKPLPWRCGHQYEQGAKAFRVGASADANPFRGIPKYGWESEAWLQGWLDAKEQAATADGDGGTR